MDRARQDRLRFQSTPDQYRSARLARPPNRGRSPTTGPAPTSASTPARRWHLSTPAKPPRRARPIWSIPPTLPPSTRRASNRSALSRFHRRRSGRLQLAVRPRAVRHRSRSQLPAHGSRDHQRRGHVSGEHRFHLLRPASEADQSVHRLFLRRCRLAADAASARRHHRRQLAVLCHRRTRADAPEGPVAVRRRQRRWRPDGATQEADVKTWKAGYIVGGGVETAISDRLRFKAEYSFVDFPTVHPTDTSHRFRDFLRAAVEPDVVAADEAAMHLFRLGLNYASAARIPVPPTTRHRPRCHTRLRCPAKPMPPAPTWSSRSSRGPGSAQAPSEHRKRCWASAVAVVYRLPADL